MEHIVFTIIDLLGTFAFAISGAVAAEEGELDIFGVFVIAYVTGCGGGVLRDLSIGDIPPAGISDWRYLACAMIASGLTIWARPLMSWLKQPVILFDSLGLGFFAVFGAHKSLLFGHNIEAAIFLGTVTAIGGGVMRDVLLNRVPIILRKEIYAIAALLGATIQVTGEKMEWALAFIPWVGALTCMALRLFALRYSWSLPVARK